MLARTLQDKDFVGREDELSALFGRIVGARAGKAESAVLSGPRGIGKTELLKQLFGILFWKQDGVAPFYYTVNAAFLSVEAFSRSYLITFLCQRLAFNTKEQFLLSSEGMSLESVSALVEDRGADWAREIIEQYRQDSGDPGSALRIALDAPNRSALTTGIPVAVLIDEFHRLKDLHIDGVSDPRLASLFEGPLSFKKTPHVITGNSAEVQEMPVASGLKRIPLEPLGSASVSSNITTLFQEYDAEGNVSPLLLRHLGGNPFYVRSVIRTACAKKNLVEKDFWNAYIQEIMEGTLARYWSAALKRAVPDLALRRAALATAHKIYHTREPLSCQRIATAFSLTDDQAETIAKALYLAGYIRGEFGVFRSREDAVLRDIIDCLYRTEILAKPAHDLEREFLEKLLPMREDTVRYDVTLPMEKEAELVAAQCIEQICKNLKIDQDTIGQLQIAVIEGCINAIEHSKGTENKIYVSVASERDRLEISIESSGQEFIVQETGEPFGDRGIAKAPGRGWGLKLMKRYADDVRFEKTLRGIKTVLIKNLGKTADVKKEGKAGNE
jgi:stage II sporulation protein AB (anti-sigma F factor)